MPFHLHRPVNPLKLAAKKNLFANHLHSGSIFTVSTILLLAPTKTKKLSKLVWKALSVCVFAFWCVWFVCNKHCVCVCAYKLCLCL